jgi:EAL domain-containing protein (putative c-di-GMP-specific phosphodiesterase class I)
MSNVLEARVDRDAPTWIPPTGTVPSGLARALVVDDEPSVRRLLVRMLGRLGVTTIEAGDGTAGVELCRTHDFDLVITDVTMPHLGGVEMVASLRRSGIEVPVIVMTGSPDLASAIPSVALGVCRYLAKPIEPEALATAVSSALEQRRRRRITDQAMAMIQRDTARIAERDRLSAHLTEAIQRLWLAYQPIVDIATGVPVAYEALVRSDSPGLEGAGPLIDAAEQLGRMVELDQAVRRHAADLLVTRPDVPAVFVNVHPLALLDPDLTDPDAPLSRVARRVVLEITERAALSEITDLARRLARLRALGFRIALDDLGAGHSNLLGFASLRPEVVKLDRELVRELHEDPVRQHIVRSVTQLAHALGMKVVAEGIEKPEELDAVRALDCDLAQGFLLARPARKVPA